MRKIFFTYSTGFCGSDGHEVVEYKHDVTDEQLDQDAWQGAVDNASMYGYYPTEDAPEDYNDEEWDGGDEYTDSIEGSWEDYDPVKHEGYVS